MDSAYSKGVQDMSKFFLEWKGTEALSEALLKKSQADWETVGNDSLVDMFNRGAHPPGTPEDTRELILSRNTTKASGVSNFAGEFGYSKDYSVFVEYGHRTRSGGYVPGQYYLKKNVDAQRPIYRSALLEEMRK